MTARHAVAALAAGAALLALRVGHRTEEARAIVGPVARDAAGLIHDPEMPASRAYGTMQTVEEGNRAGG